MLQMNVKKLMRAILILMLIALTPAITASAVDNRPTGSNIVNTDGSTTLFPILQIDQYEFPAAFPGESIRLDSGNGTGSGHGLLALLSQIPIQSGNGGPNEPIDVALSSSTCGSNHLCLVTPLSFTEDTLTSTAYGFPTALTLHCSQLSYYEVAKDAVTILVNQAKATCILASAKPYITSNEIYAIWSGLPYTDETHLPTGTAGAPPYAWNDFWPGCGAENIVPITHIIGSGTRESFLGFTGINAGNEQTEFAATGLGRFTANSDVEHDISINPSHMGYTSMAFDNANTAQLPLALSTNYNLLGKTGPQAAAAPNYTNVANSVYPFSSPLHYYYKTGQSKQAVLDLLSFLLSSAGQGNIKKEGFIAVADARNPNISGGQEPAPDWDVNSDHLGNILDVTSIGGYFGQTGPASGDPNFPIVRGWVRADVNFDGQVNILDLTTFGPHMGDTW